MSNDLTGKRFGKLSVLYKTDRKKNGSFLWTCRCDCGNEKEVTARDLNSARVKSCGCSKGNSRSLVGKRFGMLVVIADSGEKQGTSKMWLCKCDCGSVKKIRTDSLTSGKVISCGCQKKTQKKIDELIAGRKLSDHTSDVFFKNTLSKNNRTGVNGVCQYRGEYIAYIGYKNKIYRLTVTKDFDDAVRIRKEAEANLDDFENWYRNFKSK